MFQECFFSQWGEGREIKFYSIDEGNMNNPPPPPQTTNLPAPSVDFHDFLETWVLS